MPFYNNWHLTHQRMMELYSKIAEPCEIILVNDASTDREIDDGVGFWQHKSGTKHTIRYVKNKQNQGFSYSMNRGARVMTGENLVLLSNDVEIYNDFEIEISELLQENPKYFIGAEILWYDTGWNVVNGVLYPYANGWFLACTKRAWLDIGGFDLRYGKFDWEDVDLSTTALSKGYVLKGLSKSKLKHLGGQTVYKYHPDRVEVTKKNRLLFMEKWSGK